MSDGKTTDRFARVVGALSFAVPVAAVVVALLTLGDQQRQFRVLQSEQLTILIDPHVDGPLRITDSHFGALGHVVQVPWRLLLSNTGNQRLPIVRYDVSACGAPGLTFYSDIDGGVVTADQQPVALPLALDPGESEGLFVFVGVLASDDVYNVLSLQADPAALTTATATLVLGRQNLDLYGNPVAFRETGEGAYLLTIDPQHQESPTFCFEFVTGRGNVFTRSASYYGSRD